MLRKKKILRLEFLVAQASDELIPLQKCSAFFCPQAFSLHSLQIYGPSCLRHRQFQSQQELSREVPLRVSPLDMNQARTKVKPPLHWHATYQQQHGNEWLLFCNVPPSAGRGAQVASCGGRGGGWIFRQTEDVCRRVFWRRPRAKTGRLWKTVSLVMFSFKNDKYMYIDVHGFIGTRGR